MYKINPVFQEKKPYQIAGSLLQAVANVADLLNMNREQVLHTCHDLAIDICTMTEYMHHVRENKTDKQLVDMYISISRCGCTEANFIFQDCVSDHFFHYDSEDAVLHPCIYNPYEGYGMTWEIKIN